MASRCATIHVGEAESAMDKRKAVLSILDPSQPPAYVPAAFFTHFDAAYHFGTPAVAKHLEFFRATGMDFVKIQYERKFPTLDWIRRPTDWARMPCYGKEFYAPVLEAVDGLVQAAGSEALVVVTLYSPFMCAGHTAGLETLVSHLHEDPEAVKPGLQTITESLMVFVQECIRLGVDGFYHSTQGGEAGRFRDPALFRDYVKPFDLVLMQEINRRCPFNILHVCDYHLGYDDLTPFLDYPGHVVNCSPHVGGRVLSGAEIAALFGRPFMGGMDRKGVLATGTPDQVREEARRVLRGAPERFILAADCTVPPGTPWENLRAAIEEAHSFRR